MFFNNKNQLVYAKQFLNGMVNHVLLPNISHSVQTNAAIFLHFKNTRDFQQGVLQTVLGPLLMVSDPIVKEGGGAQFINGTFVSGKLTPSCIA